MHIVVLGAGVVGVTTAWYLRQQGHTVTVIDRQAAAGLETSFANGGQLSASYAEPWANPHTLRKALSWLGDDNAPLRLCWHWDSQLIRWLSQFVWESRPSRCQENIKRIISLCLHSRSAYQALLAQRPFSHDQGQAGILHFYTDNKEYAWAAKQAELMNQLGCTRQPLSATDCTRIEPALAHMQDTLVGGILTPDDGSGDAHQFTQQLSQYCRDAGVEFLYEHVFLDWQQNSKTGHIDAIKLQQLNHSERIVVQKADGFVLALGSYSPRAAKPLGLRLPIYPAKGYSATLDILNPDTAPKISITDDSYKIVFTPLGKRLRIAGTAELNGFDLSLSPHRCQLLLDRCHALFPDIHHGDNPHFWTGLRPATPNNVPLIGQTRIPNLYLNTGHGTLGWTMACGSADVLAKLIDKQALPCAIRPLRV